MKRKSADGLFSSRSDIDDKLGHFHHGAIGERRTIDQVAPEAPSFRRQMQIYVVCIRPVFFGEPVTVPDQVRGWLSPKNDMAAMRASTGELRCRIRTFASSSMCSGSTANSSM